MRGVVLQILRLLLGRRFMWRLGRALYCLGRHETGTTTVTAEEELVQQAVIRSVAQPVILDVGANVGVWSARALSFLKEREGALLAFEPDEDAMRQLQSRLGGDARVRLINKAVGNGSGTVHLHIQGPGAGTNSIVDSLGYEDVANTVPVTLTNLPDALKEHGIAHAHLIKIDAEGYDLQVLKGAKPLLEQGRASVIQFEYNHRWIFSRSYLLDVFTLIDTLPYMLGKVTSSGLEIYERWHPELERYFECNYLCVHKTALSWFSFTTVSWDKSNTVCARRRSSSAAAYSI
jgi:FkbM family methyltransferase